MLVRCLENTSPAETLVNKVVLEDLVKCGVFFSHYISTQRRGDTEFLCDIRVTHCSESEKKTVITTII